MSYEVELSAISACVGHRWSPQIGDPTVAGWGTVVAYAFCAVLGFIALLRVQDSRERIFWGLVTLAMLSLGEQAARPAIHVDGSRTLLVTTSGLV